MKYENIMGVPNFVCDEYLPKKTKYCILIPIINEGERIIKELETAQKHGINELCDIIICDGGSKDASAESEKLKALGVNTLLIKLGDGKQGAQLRMGFWWALQRDYDGFITIDGNNKDSIEDVPLFLEKLDAGYDFVQGSRFIKHGKAIHTPPLRWFAVRFIHAPIISIAAGHWFTDTTNAYRAHSRRYIEHPAVAPFRDIFIGYELLAYLSVKATQIGLRVCEVPVKRKYPAQNKTPTKIKGVRGNFQLLKILFITLVGGYNA